MIRSLVRLLGLSGEAGPSRVASTRRFTPRLEVLDGRAMPSVMVVGAIDGYGGRPGGVFASNGAGVIDESGGLSGRDFGNGAGGGASGGVIGDAVGGGVSVSIELSVTRSTGEEIPQTIV
jgi:hypothetical protein